VPTLLRDSLRGTVRYAVNHGDVRPEIPNGRPVSYGRPEVVRSSLEEVKKRALEGRRQRSQQEIGVAIQKLSALTVGTYAVGSPPIASVITTIGTECRD